MGEHSYLILEYQRLMHLAAIPNDILLSMTRKFVESCLHELLIFHGEEVSDSISIEKLRDKVKSNKKINFPPQRDIQVQTIQSFGNLSVHHKHDPVNCIESWGTVYPALRDFTRWIFRDVFDICEEFDNFQPMELTFFSQYGFNLHSGIFRMKDNSVDIDNQELRDFSIMGTALFAGFAPELYQTLRNASQFLFVPELPEEQRRLLFECIMITAWFAPFTGLLAMNMDRYNTSSQTEVQQELAEQMMRMMDPKDNNLDPEKWA